MEAPVENVDGTIIEEHQHVWSHEVSHEVNWSHVAVGLVVLVALLKMSSWDWGNNQDEGGASGGVTSR